MDPERWQLRYRQAVQELDTQQRSWQAADGLLRRIAGRLCIAARGQHEALDQALQDLARTLRRPAEAEPLESLLEQLTQAVAALDARGRVAPPGVTVEVSPTDPDETAALRELLLRLLDRLDARGADTAELRASAGTAHSPAAQAALALQLADALERQVQALSREKLETSRLLQQLSGRLEEMTGHLKGEETDRAAAQAEGQQLDRAFASEKQQLFAHLREAADLPTLQQQVQSRLEAIDTHLRDHRQREGRRTEAQRARAEKLRGRIEELEDRMQVLQRSLRKSERQALTDGLTGVANRKAYDERIAHEIKHWQRDGRPRSLAAFDIDHFKRINDEYGHQAGDRVLQLLGRHLMRRLRETDFIARYGGEEFVLLFADTTASQALTLSEKLRETVAQLGFHFRRMPVNVTVSVGVASFAKGDTPESVFGRADKALYEAKHSGRNRCVAA